MIQVAHTYELDAHTLADARRLLDAVFDGELTDHDWEHGLGGIHALAWDGGELVGHASVVQRRLVHAGRALRAGYVEAVGVRPDRQRRGIGAALMEPLEQVVGGAYELGALGTTDEARRLYAARGWQPWRGPTFAITLDGIKRTPDDDDSVYVLEAGVPLDLTGSLTCDWRDGDVW